MELVMAEREQKGRAGTGRADEDDDGDKWDGGGSVLSWQEAPRDASM